MVRHWRCKCPLSCGSQNTSVPIIEPQPWGWRCCRPAAMRGTMLQPRSHEGKNVAAPAAMRVTMLQPRSHEGENVAAPAAMRVTMLQPRSHEGENVAAPQPWGWQCRNPAEGCASSYTWGVEEHATGCSWSEIFEQNFCPPSPCPSPLPPPFLQTHNRQRKNCYTMAVNIEGENRTRGYSLGGCTRILPP
jgi:hypothetical protein